MPLDVAKTRKLLPTFEFKPLFIEELGWNHHDAVLEVPVDGRIFTLSAIAQKCGMAVFICNHGTDGRIPDYPTRYKIERQVAKSAHEHLIIFIDGKQTRQVWQWVRREHGKPAMCREHAYHAGQPGDSLIQKLQTLAVSLEEEENLTLPDVTGRARKAFDVEHVTKKFYDRFKTEHTAFFKFLEGIPGEEKERWYVSVMLNRLMFIYFIQKKGFLNNDTDYLKNKLAQCKKELGKDCYYRNFLCPLFFEGFAKRKEERAEKTREFLGEVPYLNGGIFMPHPIEQLHGKTITIPDKAFEKVFEFFDAYHWHLDERPLKADDEINPDVLGYIFEKYINQKQMGAYYTKEDITQYISKNTVIPFLFDAVREKCKIACEGERSIWRLIREDPDRYIYPAVKHGAGLQLPSEIAEGIANVSKRDGWNKPAPVEYALPTEIWREVVARRKRCEEVSGKLAAGEVRSINDLITYNLDIRQFAQDVIEHSEGPELLVAFWKAIESVTVLDPACGSGAFLFAALNILEPLYEASLERMRFFLEEWGEGGKKNHPNYHKLFTETLKRVEDHPNYRYFIFKSIIVNNLYGVDIMEEAIEICKLRLFLKLVAQIERVEDIEPLPDIDFNIRSGNTLVGFASLEEMKKYMEGDFFRLQSLPAIEEEAEIADRAFCKFREMQIEQGMKPADFIEAKENLRSRLKKLTDELDRFLAGEYGVDVKKKDAFNKWYKSHQPFHWFAEFYGILKSGGFDVVIGNPPYVEYSKVKKNYTVKNYATEQSANLYAFISERSLNLLAKSGGFGFIVPISVVCTQRMKAVQDKIALSAHSAWFSDYAERPSKLFEGAEVLLTIAITRGADRGEKSQFTTGFTKWAAEERPCLFERLSYCQVNAKPKPYVIPKLSGQVEVSILEKMVNGDGLLAHKLQKNSHHRVYYRIGGGRYWKIFTNFQPRFVLNGKPGISSRENYLFLPSEALRDATITALSSSLFYWYFILTTNCRDLNPSDLSEFPINLDTMSPKNLQLLGQLCAKLMKDYKAKTELKEKTSSLTGDIVYQEFYPRLSKPILDEIDRVLAKHYGFTDEELDFIINYDIKYRIGKENQEGE